MKYTFDILSQISDMFPQMSSTEEKLASFILADPQKAVSLSISDLADQCGVSISTVSRFCRHLSLNGYQDFRLELMRSLAVSSAADAPESQEINSDDSVPALISKMTALYSYAYAKTVSGIDVAAFSRIADMIDAAADVHFVGTGNMLPIALAAKLQFMSVSSKFHCNLDSASQALSTSLMDENSLVIIFTYTGEYISSTEIAKFARARNAKVVAITRYSQSKIIGYCDEVLLCYVIGSSRQYSALPVCAGMQFIVDLLFTEYCRRNPQITAENREKTIGFIIGQS